MPGLTTHSTTPRSLLWAVGLLAGVAACGAAPDEAENAGASGTTEGTPIAGETAPAEAAPTVAEQLAAQGLEQNEFLYRSDGTPWMDLDEAEGLLAAAREKGRLVEKGYKFGGDMNFSGGILLYAITSIPENAALALLFAAIDWANNGVPYTLDPALAGSVTFMQAANLDSSNKCYLGFGQAPANGLPGLLLTVNTAFNCNVCGVPNCPCTTWNFNTVPGQELLHLMTHEFGHTLGLAHPGEGPLIPGTASGNYPSVMRNGCIGGNYTQNVSADDALSVSRRLP